MLNHTKKYLFLITALTGFILSFLSSACFAGILDSWESVNAYKPRPVLFLHGFAKGNPGDWNPARTTLTQYFSKYRAIGPYLETINFQESPDGAWLPVRMTKTPNLTSGNLVSTLNYNNLQVNIGLTDLDFDPDRQ